MSFERRTIELRVQDTKGKARRLVPLNDEALNALLRLRAVVDEFFPDTQWVFTHTKPRYFGTRFQSVRKVWETAIGRAGIPVRRQNLVDLKLPELREALAHQVVLMLITVMHLLAERQGL